MMKIKTMNYLTDTSTASVKGCPDMNGAAVADLDDR